MKNQTEILKLHNVSKNTDNQHISESLSNYQNTKTALKIANTNQLNKQRIEKTPHVQILTKNISSGKLVRVSSNKGINIYSLRQSSSEKEVKLNYTQNNFTSGETLQATIKLDDDLFHQQIKEQLKKATQVYQQKMKQQLLAQQNSFTAQIDHLKQIIAENQSKLVKQQFELDDLLIRVQKIEKRVEKKIHSMENELTQFQKFYDQCYIYTLQRISEVEQSIHALVRHVQQATSTTESIQAWKYVQYANILIKNIVAGASAQSSSLKYYLDAQIYELEMVLGKFHEEYEKIDRTLCQMREIQFGNESVREAMKQWEKIGINKKEQQIGNVVHDHYQQKIKDTIKKVKDLTIQIDLFQTFMSSQCSVQHELKITQLEQVIRTLQKKVEEDKLQYSKQLEDKQNIINSQKIQFQNKVQLSLQCQQRLTKQVTQLKLKISDYETQRKKSYKQHNTVDTQTSSWQDKLISQKMMNLEKEISVISIKNQELQQKLKELDNQKQLLIQKLSAHEQQPQQQEKLILLTKMLEECKESNLKLVQEVTQFKKEREKTSTLISELQIQNMQSKQKITSLLSQKNLINEDYNQYLHSLQTQIQNNDKQLQNLHHQNDEYFFKNRQLVIRNNELEDDLNTYAQTFQKQSIIFRNALEKLKKQNDFLNLENRNIHEENKNLKINLQSTMLAQSFYGNCSSVKNTIQTEYDEILPINKFSCINIRGKDKTDKIEQLKNILQKLGYELPAICQIDGTGYLKDEKTGCYLMDENNNCFQFDHEELTEAVKTGLILL